MRRWTVPVAAALLTVFVGCGTASADEKVNIQTELTPAAGEMPAAEFLPPENESLADRTEVGAPADTVSAGEGAESEDVSGTGIGAADASEGIGMAGVGAPDVSAGAGTVGDGVAGEGAPGVSASGAAGDGMADTNAGAPGNGAAGEGMVGAGESAGMTGTGAAGDGTPGVGASGASEGTPEETSGNTDGASSLDLSAMAGQVFALINAQRSGAGIATLEWDDNLSAAAQTRAGELAVSFSHTRPDGSRGADITGVAPCGENLASTKGSLSTAENVVGKWTKSGAHSENILCADYTKAGVALYQASNGTVYWVVLFTGE